jgi:4-amino-4-deoxy-L-arabinose transferase-like glycosyltransferase
MSEKLSDGATARPLSRLILLFLGVLLLNTLNLGQLPLVDRDEPRFAEAAREMRERGDWIVPWFNNLPRYDKPPLIYWAQIAAYACLGETETAARLPSALAGALTCVLVALWGRRMFGERAGLWAGAIYGTSLQALVHHRLAVADPLLVLAMTAAAWAGWEMLRPPPADSAPDSRWRWWWAFHLALALGFLAKGPVAWLPWLAVLVLGRLARSSSIVCARPHWLVTGLLLSVAIVATWGLPALARTGGEFAAVGLGRHVVQRSLAPLEGHGAAGWVAYLATLPFFFVTVFPSFFPWSCWLPRLVRTWWRDRGADFAEMYLVTGIALTFGVFTLVRTKLPHYTLPAFPLLALWLAGTWFRQGWPLRPLRLAVAGMAVFTVVAALVLGPLATRQFPTPALFAAVQPWLKPDMRFASVGYQEPSLVWCFRARLRGFHALLDETNAADFMAQDGPSLLILPTEAVPRVFPSLPPEWRTARVNGLNLVHGKRADLTVLVKQ